jgi:hypothetical protein
MYNLCGWHFMGHVLGLFSWWLECGVPQIKVCPPDPGDFISLPHLWHPIRSSIRAFPDEQGGDCIIPTETVHG